MSIRKPKTSTSSMTKSSIANAINATLNRLANNSSTWDVSTASNAGCYHINPDWATMVHPVHPKLVTTKMETPDWVDEEAGYDVEVFKLEDGCYMENVHTVVATYRPKKTLSVGFVRIYFVDKDDKPFPQMKGVWSAFKEAQENSTTCGCKLADGGKISGAFGIPSVESICSVAWQMRSIYDSWRHFPNESDFDMVKRLLVAIGDVKTMQRIEEDKSYAGDIERKRKKIQELQDEISQLEKCMNDIYEKAADAMNLLEEHGVDMEKVEVGQDCMYNGEFFTTDGFSPISVDSSDLKNWTNYACDTLTNGYATATLAN